VRPHVDRDDEVARRATAFARSALAGQPDALSVLDAGWDARTRKCTAR